MTPKHIVRLVADYAKIVEVHKKGQHVLRNLLKNSLIYIGNATEFRLFNYLHGYDMTRNKSYDSSDQEINI